MVLSIKNVGRFYKEANIEINGITIIAGENGTGKSTLGKALYCIFNSFYDINHKARAMRINSIRIKLSNALVTLSRESRVNVGRLARIIVDHENKLMKKETILEVLQTNEYPLEELDDQEANVLVADIIKTLETEENEIINRVVERVFSRKFGGQLQHVNHTDEKSVISTYIKGAVITIEDNFEAEFAVEQYLPLKKDIIYIDDEDSLESNINLFNNLSSYQDSLNDKIVLKKKDNGDVIGDILSEERYKRIIERMNNARIGELIRDKRGDFEYKEYGLNKSIRIENVSSGTKIMVLIKQILLNGYLEDNGIMVLDEPEIHLHPEWQKILAEIIVLMQVEFNMNILISTHSSDFVAFIQYYSKINNISGLNKAYLIENGEEENTSEIKEVTENIDEIYKMLGEPFINVSGELSYES